MTCPDDDTLAALATLPEGQRAAIADHAATCDSCRAIVTGLLEPSFAEAETMASDQGESRAPGMPAAIDRYRIERHIGAGAMGVVYGGYDPELARPVAVKVLKIGGSRDRMKREAQALAKLTHPNVVAVYDVGEHDGAAFVTMALVDGENLRTWLATERTTEQILEAIRQAGRGVEAAHKRGIVHRDLKPDNIFIARSGDVLVGDFGLATSSGEIVSAQNLATPVDELTQTGAVVGTPAYMAPEQLDGEARPASDQFSLCVTAWEALYGTRPFTGKSLAELVAAVRAGPPAEPRTRDVPAHVRAAIRRGLAADPSARHPSMTALLAALAPRRRRWPVVAGGFAVLAATGALVFALRDDDSKSCDTIALRAQVTIPATPSKPMLAKTIATIHERYAASWLDVAKSSCKAAASSKDPIYVATKRCLDRRAAVLAWIVEQAPDPFELLGFMESLEPVESCKLAAPGPAPSPELAALERDLDRAAVGVNRGPTSVEGLGELLERAGKLDDPTAIAEASYLLAVSRQARGLDAKLFLQKSIEAAERARDDRTRTRVSALLATNAAKSGRIAEATTHRELAVSAAARANDPLTMIAVERANIAIAFARGDFKTEIAALRRIEEIATARFGDLSRLVIDTWFSLVGALQRTSDPGATALLDRAMAALNQLADLPVKQQIEQALLGIKDPATKIPLQETLVAIARGEDRAGLPDLLKELGYTYELAGAYDRAIDTWREGLALDSLPPPMKIEFLENAANDAFELADRSDDKAIRARRIGEALAFLDQLPRDAQENDFNQSVRGRALLLAGRYLEAIPQLTAALAAAERAEQQNPYRIAMRSFALAQALWEVGGDRDRDRARALAADAAKRMPEARAMFAADEHYGEKQVENVDAQLARVEAWRRAHR